MFKKIKPGHMLVFGLFCLSFLVALGRAYQKEEDHLSVAVKWELRDLPKSGYIYQVTTPDGDKCVVLEGYQGSGISCDFSNKEEGRNE